MPKPVAYAVVLAGGGGTRLWPASRRARPKQLLQLAGSESLLAATVRRITPVVGAERVLIVTARDQEAAIRAALPQLPRRNILAEPAARNTAGAIQIAAAFAQVASGPDALLGVIPSDQHVADERAFRACLKTALSQAGQAIVTIGVRPTAPETGFGYIRLGAAVAGSQGRVYEAAEFVEKPDFEKAKRYVKSRAYVWNAGMFFMTAERMRLETERQLPKLHRFFQRVTAVRTLAAFQSAVNRHYAEVESISIDYGVMEAARGIRVVPGDFGWSDVGSWSAVGQLARDAGRADETGNVQMGDVLVEDGADNLALSEPGAPFVGLVGVKDLIVVATTDAVLVLPRDRAQDVRKLVDALKANARNELLDASPPAPRPARGKRTKR